jgi:hypothetical protein
MKKEGDLPVACVKWYDFTKWLLERVDGFPKSQRFVLGARVSDAALEVLELLGQAAYAAKGEKRGFLEAANTRINGLRWLLRMCKDRNLFSNRQYGHASMQMEECGRMVGGWRKQVA